MLSKEAPKPRRFRIWGICILILIILSVIIVIQVARSPPEPPLSVSFVRVPNISPDGKGMIYLQVSNRMSFNAYFSTVAEAFRSNKWVHVASADGANGYLTAHSSQRFTFSSEEVRLRVSYFRERRVSPIEKFLFLNRWLSKPYYAFRQSTFTAYETVSDTRVSSESKQQP